MPYVIILVLIIIFCFAVIIYGVKNSNTDSHRQESNNNLTVAKTFSEESDNIGYITFRAAGVTYKNDDGSDRQKIIERLRKDIEKFKKGGRLNLKEFSYNGKPALAIYIDGLQIGNVPANKVDFLLEEIDKGNIVSGEIEFLGGGDLTHGVEITLGIKKD